MAAVAEEVQANAPEDKQEAAPAEAAALGEQVQNS
jgi:hypothetical protein